MKNGMKRAVCLLIVLVMAVASLAWAEDAADIAAVICGNADEVVEEQGEFLLGAPEGEDISSNEAPPMELGPEGLLIAYDDVPEETDAIALSKNGATNGPAFEDTAELDGVAVTVRADAGAFPEGAALTVSRVPVKRRRDAEKAVDAARDGDEEIVARYTFDIKVVCQGAEVQPAEGHAIEVSFALSEAADENLEAAVYHVTGAPGDYTAEKLATDVDAASETVTAASDGFSYYTVVFTYTDGNSNSYTYSMSVDERVWLWQMLQALNIEGEPSAVTVESADSAYLTAAKDDGEWYVKVTKYFGDTKTLTITVGETNYSISVKIGNVFYFNPTDKSLTDVPAGYTELTDDMTAWNGGSSGIWLVAMKNRTISSRVTVSGSVNLLLCDCVTLNIPQGITVSSGNSLTIWAQSDGGIMGALVAGLNGSGTTCPENFAGIGGKSNQYGDAGTRDGGNITINGGAVTASGGVGGAGIGGGKGGAGGSIAIRGGAVTATGGASAAGIGGGHFGAGTGENGSIEISGGTVTASGATGAGIGGGIDGAGTGENGHIVISGGAVTATGTTTGAGIGGGVQGAGTGENGTIEISGGHVTANGSNGAGIGGGNEGAGTGSRSGGTSSGNKIIISGGVVTAISTGGAGIGGGHSGAGTGENGTIEISGGAVTATSKSYGAGIGGGYNGAGTGKNGSIAISNGHVTATGGNNGGAGIGGGEQGNGGSVRITGGKVIATAGSGAKPIGKGSGGLDSGILTKDTSLKDSGENTNPRTISDDTTADPQTSVDYLDAHGDVRSVTSYTELNGQTEWKSGWYVANDSKKSISGPVTVSGDVRLILCDKADVEIGYGIRLDNGASLTVYKQPSGVSGLSRLIIFPSSSGAAIAGPNDGSASISIYGGNVICWGGCIGNKTSKRDRITLGYGEVYGTWIYAEKGYCGTLRLEKDFEVSNSMAIVDAAPYGVKPEIVDALADRTLVPRTSSDATHNISVTCSPTGGRGGSAKATIDGVPVKRAVKDSEVTLTATPVAGWGLASVTLNGTAQTISENACTFEMPDGDAAVSVVFKKAISPSVTTTGWTYGDTANTPSVSEASNPGGGDVSFKYFTDENCEKETNYDDNGADVNGGAPKFAGKYWVKATVAQTDNYMGGTGVKDFTIAKKKLTVTASDASKEYDGTALKKYAYSETELAVGDWMTFVAVTGSQTSAGSSDNVPSEAFIQSASGQKVTKCYDITYVKGTLTVTPKKLTITAGSDSKEYDGTALTQDAYTHTDLAAGDGIESVTVTGSQTVYGASDNVPGAAVIRNEKGEDVTKSYDIEYVSGTLEVTRMPLTITAKSDSKKYDGTALTNDGYSHTGLAAGDRIASVTVTGSQTVAGDSMNVPGAAKIVNRAGEDVTGCYDIEYLSGTLGVTKKALTVTAKDVTITLGETPAGGGVTYDGFVNGEDETAIGGKLAYDFDYPANGSAGSYIITPKGLTSENYEINFVPGTLTVTPKASEEEQPEPEPESLPLLATMVTDGGDGLVVTWTKQRGATGYDVYLTGQKTELTKHVAADAEQSVTFAGLKYNKKYTAYVKAHVVGGSIDSPKVTAHTNSKNGHNYYNPTGIKVKDALTVKLGKKTSLNARAQFSGMHWGSGKLTYFSTDTSVATVTRQGSVKGVGKGPCTVYVMTSNGIWRAVTVNVDMSPKSIHITGNKRYVTVGQSLNLGYKLNPANAEAEKITWESEPSTVATVDQSGKVTGIAPGRAKITVKTSNEKSHTITVIVKAIVK